MSSLGSSEQSGDLLISVGWVVLIVSAKVQQCYRTVGVLALKHVSAEGTQRDPISTGDLDWFISTSHPHNPPSNSERGRG